MSNQKQHISLFDKSYSDSNTTSYKLYIELSTNSLKHTVFNCDSLTFIGFEAYQFNTIYNDFSLITPLKEILATNPLYQKEFRSVHVAYVNNRSTLIPNAIYKADQLSSFHQFNFSSQEEDLFYSDQLINLSAHNVYSIPDYIVNEFSALKNCNFRHFSSSLIEASLVQAKNDKALSLINIHILPASFQIIVIKNQKLELYNSFIYQSSEDFIYYLLFVLDQLNINNEEATITLTGEVEKNSVIYSMLFKYIKTLNFGHRPDHLKFSYILEEIPKHFHYSLFNQFLCE